MVELPEKNTASLEWLDRSLIIEVQRDNIRYPVMIDIGNSYQPKRSALK
jgi:hypothetical protein